MTKFTYKVDLDESGVHTTVTRLADGETKTFFNKGHKTTEGLVWLMECITDDQAEQYFPKPRKK